MFFFDLFFFDFDLLFSDLLFFLLHVLVTDISASTHFDNKFLNLDFDILDDFDRDLPPLVLLDLLLEGLLSVQSVAGFKKNCELLEKTRFTRGNRELVLLRFVTPLVLDLCRFSVFA